MTSIIIFCDSASGIITNLILVFLQHWLAARSQIGVGCAAVTASYWLAHALLPPHQQHTALPLLPHCLYVSCCFFSCLDAHRCARCGPRVLAPAPGCKAWCGRCPHERAHRCRAHRRSVNVVPLAPPPPRLTPVRLSACSHVLSCGLYCSFSAVPAVLPPLGGFQVRYSAVWACAAYGCARCVRGSEPASPGRTTRTSRCTMPTLALRCYTLLWPVLTPVLLGVPSRDLCRCSLHLTPRKLSLRSHRRLRWCVAWLC